MTTRQPKSYIIKWEGTEPKLEGSHWQPGYTPAHTETVEEAFAHSLAQLTKDIAVLREKWIKLNLLITKTQADTISYDEAAEKMREAVGAFGQPLENDHAHD